MPSFAFIRKSQSSDMPDFFNRNSEKFRRLDGYKKAWEAYLSELPDPIVIDSEANDNVKVNPLRAVIEVGVYFLFGDEVRFEIAPNRSNELGLAKPGSDMKSKAANPPKHPGADPEYDQKRQEDKDKQSKQSEQDRKKGYEDGAKRDQQREDDHQQRQDERRGGSSGGGDNEHDRDPSQDRDRERDPQSSGSQDSSNKNQNEREDQDQNPQARKQNDSGHHGDYQNENPHAQNDGAYDSQDDSKSGGKPNQDQGQGNGNHGGSGASDENNPDRPGVGADSRSSNGGNDSNGGGFDKHKDNSDGGFQKNDQQNGKPGFGQDQGQKPGFDQNKPDMGSDIPEDPKFLVDLNRCWKANRKRAFLHELGISGAIHGDVFVKLIPRGAGIKGDLPRLVLLDPANVDVFTDPDDCERVNCYVITYNTETEDGKVMTREQEITPVEEEDEWGNKLVSAWEINDYEHHWAYDNQIGWHPAGADNRQQIGETKLWNYAWPPIEHCNNMELPHLFWGLPDVDESAIEVVQSVQRTMSSLTKVVRIHGNPKMFAKGVMPELASEIDISADNIITLPAGAGVDSDLKVLEALNNVSSFVEYIENLRSQLFEQLQCPPIALGQIDTMSMSMSGINLSILYAPLLQKTEMKRIPYGDFLDRINHKLLILMGHENEEEYEDLTVVWPEMMPGSNFLERQTLMEDIKLGVSNWTALQRLGYDPEREAQKKAEEMKAQQQMEFDFQSQQMELQSKLNPDQQATGGGKDPNFQSGSGGGGGKPGGGGGKPGGAGGAGGNNNPSGFGNRSGSTGAQGNSTPKNRNNPSTSKSRGGPSRG